MGFSSDVIDAVWQKLSYQESNGYKQDQCTAWIHKDSYGDRKSKYGWEIDHIKPKSEGGTDALSNLRALHWLNNASRQADRLNVQKPAVKAGHQKNLALNDSGVYQELVL